MSSDLTSELSKNFIEYAAAVNGDRAIPDATSGLKPVARRILWGAFDGGYTSSKEYAKCARIVGDVMGKWHPHGDSSIYGALVRLSQPWIMRYPLIDFHGNMGSIAGDGPAAYRYTNARLAKLSEDGMLCNLKKKNVDFIANYDENDYEPITLPSIFPNLLCNPNSGIGVAMACNWLPHNLKEVAECIEKYVDGKEYSLPGPDFPTGGIIINKDDIPMIMKTGHGSVKVRGKYKIEQQNIIFYEIPYGTTIEGLISEIGKVCDKKEIEGINDIRDESGKRGLKIVIECEKNINPESIVMKLFAKTNLQISISYNQVALVDKTPTELNLNDCLKIYVEHNIKCFKKEAEFDIKKAKERLNIVEGLLIALEDIDNIIAKIKSSDSAAAAKDMLIKDYKMNEIQAKSVLDMKLAKLAKLEKIEIQKEKEELLNSIDKLNHFLITREEQITELKNRLNTIVRKYGDDRRTELTQIDVSKEDKEIQTITPVDCVVLMTKNGDIKRVAKSNFKVQKRNGKGVKSLDDTLLDAISTNTIDNLMLFTNKGKMYKLLVDLIPEGTNVSKGVYINNLINLEPQEQVIAINSFERNNNARFVFFITKKGQIKKTSIEEYKSIKKTTGIVAIKLNDGDSIANVVFADDEDFIVITEKGMSIHFETKSISAIGRNTVGVKSIKLDDNDLVLTGLPIKEQKYIAIVTDTGLGKKVKITELPPQGRAGKGVYIYKGANIAGAELVDDEDNLLVIGNPNSICISVSDLPILSRIGIGNQVIKNATVQSIVKI